MHNCVCVLLAVRGLCYCAGSFSGCSGRGCSLVVVQGLLLWASPVASGKESTCNAGDSGDVGSVPGWRRKWQPTPVFLPRQSHGQRNLVDYSSWGCNESDMTE